jgi:hypothetical protein
MKNIIHKSSAIYSAESCKKAINWFEENIDKATPGIAGDKDLNNLELSVEKLEDKSDFFNLGFTILKVLEEFKEEYKLFDSCLDDWHLDIAQILMCKWEPNNYYNHFHCEMSPNDLRELHRVFSWMIYLNDIEHGGGTEFIYQNIITEPRAGDFYIFPSSPSHIHRELNAPLETKYTITGHFFWVCTEGWLNVPHNS